jgi:hypothetical protein
MTRLSVLSRAAAVAIVALPVGGAAAQGGPWAPATAERCTPAAGDARAALGRAWRAAGLDRLGGRVAHFTATDVVQQNYQSDRSYPPFFSHAQGKDVWLDPATGVERTTTRVTGLGTGGGRPFTTLADARATFGVRDTALVPVASFHLQTVTSRPLDAWATLADWRAAAAEARVVARCVYREYPRLVLERPGAFGPERLYLDDKTGLPVKLDREEPHYLWGQLRAEYQYQTWTLADGALHPGAVFRVTDGALDVERVEGSFALAPADSAPRLTLPPVAAPMEVALPAFVRATPPDTERAGAATMLLRNAAYGEGVVVVRDTVYLLDATQGEARARLDSAWIARLYPRHRAVVLVVTDLAWPHVAGVRFWVARGAAVVSHESSRPFLERVVARRWTREPDALERVRARTPARARLRFTGVRDSLALAGGALRLYPIDGVASEGALMAFNATDGVLWASDYVQTLREPALYTAEVARAVARVGIAPRVVAAQHLPPTAWERVVPMAKGVPAADAAR